MTIHMTLPGPDISVIVVTYNQGATLGRTLDSILSQQTDARFEIIIGDDASSDDTLAVCNRYADWHPGKIRILRRERNLGVVANYFDCIKAARGRYIADCAGDDFWIDNSKLQRQFELLESHPEVSLVHTAWRISDPDGANPKPAPAGAPEIHLCTAMYRRDTIMRELENSKGQLADPDFANEDRSVIEACLKGGRTAYIPIVTLNYCVGHDSVSHRPEPSRAFDYLLATFRQERWLRDYFGLEPFSSTGKFKAHTGHLVAMAFRSGDPARRDAMTEELKLHPEMKAGIKSRLYKAIMRSPRLWRIVRALILRGS